MELIALIILLLLAAATAAAEISVIAANRIKLRRLSHEGSMAARMILKIIKTPERFFSTILVANDIVDALIAVLVTAIIINLIGKSGNTSILLATIVAAFLIIVSEVTAKTLAARYSERMSLVLARPIQWLIDIFSPVVRILEFIIKQLIKAIGGKAEGVQSLVTDEEIKALIKIGEEEGVLHKEKYRMLSKVFDFGETVVKNVMTHKKEVVAIDINSALDDILARVLESGYSRLPVYKDRTDNIVGIINMKDLLILSSNRELVVIQDIIYPATVVSDSKKVTELLKEFQKGHTHLAIVVDKNNKVEGIVTIEDLLEEIVGEIEDEYDVRATNYKTKVL
ncbi:MAG: hemolysin family protein [Candidatus Omnitrophota bacterium]|nr:hemolysin family protein [Candidatus Omnitrophota bacterium]